MSIEFPAVNSHQSPDTTAQVGLDGPGMEGHREHNPNHIFSKVSPIVFNGFYS